MNEIDINLGIIEYNKEKILFELYGKNVNSAIANSIRRSLLSLIPVYGFHRNNIKITKNTSITNNDMIYERLEQIPLYDVYNQNIIKNISNIINQEIFQYLYINYEKRINDNVFDNKSNKDIEYKKLNFDDYVIKLNVQNNNNSKRYVNTHDLSIYKNEKLIKNTYKDNKTSVICILRDNEEISIEASATIGIAKINSLWTAIDTWGYEEINENKYKLKFCSSGCYDSKVILYLSIYILIEKLNNIKKFLKKYEKKINNGKTIIELCGEDSTIGNLISYYLQIDENIESAGYTQPQLLESNIIIEYIVKDLYNGDSINLFCKILDKICLILSKCIKDISF